MLAVHPRRQALTRVGKQTTKRTFGYIRIWLPLSYSCSAMLVLFVVQQYQPAPSIVTFLTKHICRCLLLFAPTNTTATMSKPYYLLPGVAVSQSSVVTEVSLHLYFPSTSEHLSCL